VEPDTLLVGMVGRLVEQKGVDVVIEALPEMMKRKVQFAVLGSGDAKLEAATALAASEHLGRITFSRGYNEALAHRIEAGADVFLMPSRFEPCGLNQLYSLRYGTLPIVHGVGGLADTVVDANQENIKAGTATGFVMESLDVQSIVKTLDDVLERYADCKTWKQLVQTAMAQDFSWPRSADQYLELYQTALAGSPH
jgi:starch synthase